jgi:hypothetical protein
MRIALLCLLVACGSTPPKPAAPAAPLDEFKSWVGDWASDDGSTEHWVLAGGALFGVSFHGDEFTVKIIDDGDGTGKADGVLRYITIPNGTASTEERTVNRAKFSHVGSYRRASGVSAEELEQADLTFAADTAATKIEGWMKWFAPSGGMLRKGQRIEGDAIRETMGPLLASGTLAWAPVVARRAPSNKLGFTVGTAKFMSDTPGEDWASAYITIWQQQPDGSWKVTFDTGRPTQQP